MELCLQQGHKIKIDSYLLVEKVFYPPGLCATNAILG